MSSKKQRQDIFQDGSPKAENKENKVIDQP